MMSLIFIVAFISLMLLPITCLSILISLSSSSSSNGNHDHSMRTNQRRSISTLLFSNTFFSTCNDLTNNQNGTKMSCGDKGMPEIKQYQKGNNNEEKVECGVCLSAIEEGDEIRELRCNHLFHKECLDSWVSTGSATCPMCRGVVRAAPMMVESAQGSGVAELLVFEFCSSSSRRRRRRYQRVENWFH